MLARQRAVEALRVMPCNVFVDGKRRIAGLTLPQTPILEGDRLHPSISAASIIAKVSRDRIMEELEPFVRVMDLRGTGVMARRPI
jgi:ribonuclease HII